MNLTTSAASFNTLAPGEAEALPQCRHLIGREHPLRRQVEQFIAQRFFEVHAARISEFMPELIALFDAGGQILAAVGFRSADGEILFLEHYLDTPVEHAIACHSTRALPQREGIVEIGNLASIDRGASRKLFAVLAGVLHARGYEWAVFTGCSSLHRMFKTLGIETVYLGRALQSRLPVDQQTWGGYYEDNPRVVAGKVSRGRVAFDSDTDLPDSKVAA